MNQPVLSGNGVRLACLSGRLLDNSAKAGYTKGVKEFILV
ncbi:conserved hypothetical protein [delta proteobacterium NaphS2]|nr:conserved hypothetical protein [delta proteobacterium NaphS2]